MTDAKPVRRIVTIDDGGGRSKRLADGPATDIRTDPARPGFSSARIWVTDGRPLQRGEVTADTARLAHTIEPPPRGSVCRIVTFPPDDVFRGHVSQKEVAAYFEAMGSPGASTWSPGAPHPYMQKTRTLDFCIVLEGWITLVLDTAEVHLAAGDTVVQRGTSHAWSNRSAADCVIAFTQHDGGD